MIHTCDLYNGSDMKFLLGITIQKWIQTRTLVLCSLVRKFPLSEVLFHWSIRNLLMQETLKYHHNEKLNDVIIFLKSDLTHKGVMRMTMG
jgi:hypothetical protein